MKRAFEVKKKTFFLVSKVHLQIKIHNEHLKSINKIEKYKKLNMTKHKTDMNITKIEKYKKLNMTEHKTDINTTKNEKYRKLNMTEHKTDMSITKIDKYKKTEQHFYDGAQNRNEHY